MAGKTGRVTHLNPEGMLSNPAFTQVVAIEGNTRTIYVGGQDAVDADGAIIGAGDIGVQTTQALANVERALAAAEARLEHVIKWTVYVVAGQPAEPGFHAFLQAWGDRGAPPTITVAYVSALANPEFLIEIDAVAVVPLSETGDALPRG
jgi:enamine deaminase RidA (YjgF/YER057c/UK114 family)